MRISSRTILGGALGLFTTIGVGVFAFACYSAAQQPAEPKLPEGLRHVPGDALGFIHFRAGDFLKSNVGTQLLAELRKDRDANRGLQMLEQLIGQPVGDLESVTVLMLAPPTRKDLVPFGGRYSYPSLKDGFRKDGMPKDKAIPFEKDAKKVRVEILNEAHVSLQEEGRGKGGLDPGEMMQYLEMAPLFMVTSTKLLDRKKILNSQALKEQAPPNHDPRRPEQAVLFVSDRTLLLGAPWELARYSEHMARRPGPKTRPMQSALELAQTPHLIVAGGHLPREARALGGLLFGHLNERETGALVTAAPLLVTESAIALDLGKSLDITMQFAAPNEASAENALQAVKNLRVLAELALERANEAGEPGGWKLDLERGVKKALTGAVIERKGTLVKAQLKIELTPAIFKHFSKDVVRMLRANVDRTQSVNNLKNISYALHGFHDSYKWFPPGGSIGGMNLTDPNGKRLLSWRVAVLPYLDQLPLFRQFDLTQPWDHPTNKKLIPLMPSSYVLPGAAESKEPGMTHYRVLVGPSTMFEPGRRIRFADVTDGTSNTIMVVEAAEPTIWTKPDDLPFDPKGPLPKFGVTPEGFNAAFGDAQVRFIRAGTPDDVLRALITRDGGETVTLPDEK